MFFHYAKRCALSGINTPPLKQQSNLKVLATPALNICDNDQVMETFVVGIRRGHRISRPVKSTNYTGKHRIVRLCPTEAFRF